MEQQINKIGKTLVEKAFNFASQTSVTLLVPLKCEGPCSESVWTLELILWE